MAAELSAIETSGAQEKRPELSRRTGGWRSEAPAGWGCPAWLVQSSQPVSTLSWSVGSEVGDATQLAGLVVALRHEDPKAYDGATLENGVHRHDLDEIRDDALRVADEALLPVALPGVGAAAPAGRLQRGTAAPSQSAGAAQKRAERRPPGGLCSWRTPNRRL